jgi:hypothetical protein
MRSNFDFVIISMLKYFEYGKMGLSGHKKTIYFYFRIKGTEIHNLMPHLPFRISHTILPNNLIRSWGKLGSELLENLTISPPNLISVAWKWGEVVKHITQFRGKMKLPKYTK